MRMQKERMWRRLASEVLGPAVRVRGVVMLCLLLMVLAAVFHLNFGNRLVVLEAEEGGRVLIDGQSAFCEGDCSFKFPVDSSLEIKAEAHAGFRFKGWASACQGHDPICSVRLDEGKLIQAHFVQVFPLSIEVPKGAEARWTPERPQCVQGCRVELDAGSQIKLAIHPSPGFRLLEGDGLCRGRFSDCTFKIEGPVELRPALVKTATLMIEPIEGGQLHIDPPFEGCESGCRLTVDHGTSARIQAIPAPGFRLLKGDGLCAGQFDDCHLTVDGDIHLQPSFGAVQPLNLTVEGEGQVMLAGEIDALAGTRSFDQGSRVSLIPKPARGWRFDGWTGPCSAKGLCTLVLDQAQTVGARFKRLSAFPMRVLPSRHGRVVGDGIDCGHGQTACSLKGSDVVLTAEPDPGFVFDRWVGCLSGHAATCAFRLERAHKLEARFVPEKRLKLKLYLVGPGTVVVDKGRLRLVEGMTAWTENPKTPVLLQADPSEGHFFRGWEGACGGADRVCSITGEGGIGVRAVFE